uniref:prickle planar cell polarity protein 3-like isoform X2 n=1 Tax=Myxine glutinosa TaxID=7769 RepID=UPI00358EAA53
MWSRGARHDIKLPAGAVSVGSACQRCRDHCTGFSFHNWRKICSHCRCEFEEHMDRMPGSLRSVGPVAGPGPHTISDNDSGCALEDFGWVPPGLAAEQVQRYFRCLPEDRVPLLHSPGENYRRQQLLRQLPLHDRDARHCSSLDQSSLCQFRAFVAQRQRKSIDRGLVKTLPTNSMELLCRQCGGWISGGSVVVLAARAGHDAAWHPACFVCQSCRELLVDLVCFHGDGGGLFCGRHHAERLRPRCAACDELIFQPECVQAEGSCWHPGHFCCFECDGRLEGHPYAMRSGRPYCCSCHQGLFALYCDACGQQIGVDEGHMTYYGQHWHAKSECFSCLHCQKSLLGLPFLPRQGSIFCSKVCSKAARDASHTSTFSNTQAPPRTCKLLSTPPRPYCGDTGSQDHIPLTMVNGSKSTEEISDQKRGLDLQDAKLRPTPGRNSTETDEKTQHKMRDLQQDGGPKMLKSRAVTQANAEVTATVQPLKNSSTDADVCDDTRNNILGDPAATGSTISSPRSSRDNCMMRRVRSPEPYARRDIVPPFKAESETDNFANPPPKQRHRHRPGRRKQSGHGRSCSENALDVETDGKSKASPSGQCFSTRFSPSLSSSSTSLSEEERDGYFLGQPIPGYHGYSLGTNPLPAPCAHSTSCSAPTALRSAEKQRRQRRGCMMS